MNEQLPVKRKPVFSAIAMTSMLVSLLLIRLANTRIDQGESIAGYSILAVMVSFIVALLLSGLVTGQIGLIRGEKPLALPVLALLLNGCLFIAVVINLPR